MTGQQTSGAPFAGGGRESVVLVRRAQAGESGARDELVHRYWHPVLRIVRLRMGARLRRYAESGDVVQEAFLAALEGLEAYRPREDAAFVAWLSRIVVTRLYALADHHHALKRDRRREVGLMPPGDVGDGPVTGPPARLASPSRAAAAREEADLLHAALAELDEDQREVVLLRDFLGASWEAIRDELGRPSVGAAKMLHQRARLALGGVLRRKGVTA